jgi:PTS system mannitol-specific IIC component
MKTALQRAGGFLAGMVVPNIGAFIAWGLVTALFIPTGWLPNPRLARLVDPMILVLLPVLIGFTGGRLVYGLRGGVVGAVATMGVVAGSTVPMFIGAMVMGPLGGTAVRAFDRLAERRVPVGFEMLVANFSAGIIGAALALAGLVLVEPAVAAATAALAAGARSLTAAGLLPLLALLIEPGKVLFLNNAINHGLLAPLGVAQVQEAGKSVFFLLETNPGPGLGLLLAYVLAGRGAARASAPGAILIQLFGGIHEIYFPYVLMNPATLAAVVVGGLAADLTFVATGAGLVATPSPGSIFAEIALTPRGGLGPVLLGIAVGAATSCLVAVPILGLVRGEEDTATAGLSEAQRRVRELKAASGGASAPARPVMIYFACEAGMGSSVLGVSVFRSKLEQAGVALEVTHSAVHELPASAEIVIAHPSLSARVREVAPRAAVYAVDDLVGSPVYDELIAALRRGDAGAA